MNMFRKFFIGAVALAIGGNIAQAASTNFGQTWDYSMSASGSWSDSAVTWEQATNWKHDASGKNLNKGDSIPQYTANTFGSTLIDGAQFINTVKTSGGRKLVTATNWGTTLNGSNLKVGVANSVDLTIGRIGTAISNMGLYVDETSKLTINGFDTQLSPSGTHSFHIDSANGLTIGGPLLKGTYQIYLGENGSIAVNGRVNSANTVVFSDIKIKVASPKATGRKIASRTLLTYGAKTGTFGFSSASASDVGGVALTKKNSVTADDGIGSYCFEDVNNAIIIKWVEGNEGGGGDDPVIDPTEAKGVIAINFNSLAKQINQQGGVNYSGDESNKITGNDSGALDYAIPVAGWLQVDEKSGEGTANVYDFTSQAVDTSRAAMVSWTSANVWSYKGMTAKILNGYLDDSNEGAVVSVKDIPFKKYDVIFYAATDSGNMKFGAPEINGARYTYANGETVEGEDAWGASQSKIAVYGTNALRVNGLSGDLTVKGYGDNGAGYRGCIAAIVIVDGEEVSKKEYTYDKFLTKEFADTGWKFDLKKLPEATITGQMSGSSVANRPADSNGYFAKAPDANGVASFQMQVYQYNHESDHYLKAVKVELKIGENGNIWARAAGTAYISLDIGPTTYDGSHEFTSFTGTPATSPTEGGYGVASMKIVLPVEDEGLVLVNFHDGVEVAGWNNQTQEEGGTLSFEYDGISLSTTSDGNFSAHASSTRVDVGFAEGSYTDINGDTHKSIVDEISTSLGLGTIAFNEDVYKSGLMNGGKSNHTATLSGLDPNAKYLIYLGFGRKKNDGTTTSGFSINGLGYSSVKAMEYVVTVPGGGTVVGTDYSSFENGVAITPGYSGLMVVRLRELVPTSEGTVIFTLAGGRAGINFLAIKKLAAEELVFENTDCDPSNPGWGNYTPATLKIPESTDLPAGTKLRIKSVTFAMRVNQGNAAAYSAEYLTINGVQSESRNGLDETPEEWSLGNRMTYEFEKDAIVTVGEEATLGTVQGKGGNGNIRIYLFRTTEEKYSHILLTTAMDTYRPVYKIVAEKYVAPAPEPEGRLYYDWTFDGTSLTSKGLATPVTLTSEGTPVYLEDDKFYTYDKALNTAATPWGNITYPATIWSAMVSGIMPIVKGNPLVTFGTKAGGEIGLIIGDSEEEVLLIRTTKDEAYSVLGSVTVENAQSATHVYVIVRKADCVKLYVDGTLELSVDVDNVQIGGGLQVGSVNGGITAGLTKVDANNVGHSAIEAIRIYQNELSESQFEALSEEFPVREIEAREPTTIYWKGGDGTIDYSTVFKDEDGNEVKYISGDEVIIEGSAKITLARGLGEVHIKNGAVLQIASASGAVSKLYVDEGGVFDVNGVADKAYPIVLNGGTLANYGNAIDDNKKQYWNLEVTANSFIDAASKFGTIASGYNSQALALNGWTLTKRGAGNFYIANATFVGGGTIDIEGGAVVLMKGTTLPNDLTVKMGENGETITAGTGFAINSGKIIFDISEALEFATNEILLLDAGATVSENDFGLTGLPEDPKQNWQIQIEDGTIVKAVNEYVLLRIGGIAYSSIEAAFKNVRSNGSKLEIVDTERLTFEDGILKEYGEAVDLSPYAVELREGDEGEIIVNLAMAEGNQLRITEVMPKSTDAVNHGTLESYDINGLASGWVEVENISDKWVDLKDYRFIRVNRSKKLDTAGYGNFPSRLIAPHSLAIFYTSERYANSADMTVSAFATPVDSEKPHIFTELNDVLVWPDKVNPKKFPFVRLYYAPNDKISAIVDTVVIPSDLPEGMSIILEPVKEGEATIRYICEAPTRGKVNPSTDNLEKLGPNVGPLYERADGKKHDSASEFDKQVPMAVKGENYEITFALNPTMSPDAVATFRDEDVITGIKLVYRKDLDDETLTELEVDLGTKVSDADDLGDTYKVSIPSDFFPAAGHLIQWKFEITDASGNTWISPSYHNKDDGYEWYGTIVEPTEDLVSEHLTTWHMFADAASVKQMDVDADKQDRTIVPNNARVAIYDSSTQQYYDYVRIDLRGNTTAGFKKKSHGLRFAKAHPLTMTDIVTGETVKEIRKSSLIAEYSDPSFLRQVLAFWLFNKNDSPAPFDFPVRCNLNGEFFELGFHSERFTDELIEDIYGLDKFGYGYKNVGSFGNGTSAGGIEKKTPDDEDETSAKAMAPLNAFCGLLPQNEVMSDADHEKYTKVVVENMDLPAWINYIALSKITQEMDDVWANLSGYWDNPAMIEGTRGTGVWMPLAYDMNTSLGVWYKEVTFAQGGLMAAQDWFKSHPFYGGYKLPAYTSEARTGTIGRRNRAYEAIFQSEKFRRLYLRRLRTLMDAELGEPNQDETYETCEAPIIVKMRELIPLISDDAALDRIRWGYGTGTAIDVWGAANFPKTVEDGAVDLYANYFVPRREHLYVTHSIDAENVGYGNEYAAGIPHKQSAIEDLKGGFDYALIEGGIVIRNANEEAIDLSGWSLTGPVNIKIPAGTVIDCAIDGVAGEVYFVFDRRAYVAENESILTDQVIIGNAEAGESPMVGLTSPDGVNVFAQEKSPQEEYLRLWGFCGVPDGASTDENEFIIFTNLCETAALDVSGARIVFEKTTESRGRCNFALADGTVIPAGGWIRLNQADVPWEKITDGVIDVTLSAANGMIIGEWIGLDQATIGGDGGVKGNGYFAKYDFVAEEWTRDLITNAPGYEPPPVPPPVELNWANTNVTEKITLAPGYIYTFANVNFKGGLELPAGEYEIKNDGKDSVNTAAFVSGAGASITFVGKGKFEVTGEGITEPLFTAKDLYITKGTFAIDVSTTTAKIAAVSLTGNFGLSGEGKLDMTLAGTQPVGIELTEKKMKADFEAGTFTATLGGTKASAFKFKGSDAVTFAGGTMEVEITGTGAKVINGGTIVFEDGYTCNVTGDEEASDVTVFEAGKTLTVNGGMFNISVPGEGSQILTTADDPEEKDLTLTINGGTFNLLAGDDCVKSAGNDAVTDPGSVNTKRNVVINGGNFYGVSIGNDVIDSNGDIIITGGNVLAYTTAVEEDGIGSTGLDVNVGRVIDVQGGNVIALGGPNSSFHYEEGVAYTADELDAEIYSEKFLGLTGLVNGQETHVWVKLPELKVETISLFAYTKGIDPEEIPSVSAEAPSEEFATGFHDLYIDDIRMVDYDGGEWINPYAVESLSGLDGVIPYVGYAFAEPVMITGVTIEAQNSTMLSIFGSAIQGANEADFSDAVRIGVVEVGNYFEGTLYEVALEDIHGPYKYIRLIGENVDKITILNLYGLKSSGELKPRTAPEVTAFGSEDGKATFTIIADKYVPQVYRVERTMVAGDGDEEAFLPLGLEDGEEYTWTDSEATPFTAYRVQGVNANGVSEWTTFTVEPKALIAGDARPTFSVKPGTYETAQSLEITYSDPAAEIWYTTDGSEPTNVESETCHLYTGAIMLSEKADATANLGKIRTSSEKFSNEHSADGFREPNGDQPYVNIIRAKAFKDGAQSQYDAYGTWLIGGNATRHDGLRVVSIQTENENLFSDETGIMVPGNWYKKVDPSQITTWDGHPYANYHQSGREWERLANIELIQTDGKEGFNQQFGIRVRGNYTRAVPKKSLTVFGRAEYGAKNLKYKLFDDEPDHNKFKRFLLRSGGNDWNGALIKDGVAQGIFRGWLKTCSQGIEPSALYINGEYWGIYNIRHGYSKKHFEDWCGVDGDNIDWVKADPAQNIQLELQEGDLVEFAKMRHYLKNTDFTIDENWQQVKTMVDLEDMIDYHIVGIFINNSDWIGNGNGNNGGYWRERKIDGKWRFTLYDCEGGLANATKNRINQILNTDDGVWTPPFFRKIAQNTEFQRMFVTRYADLLNTALKSERTQAILASHAAAIRPEIERNAARWTNIGTKAQWESRITSINSFLAARPMNEFSNMAKSFPDVTGSTHALSLAKTGEGVVQLNTIESGEGEGKFALPFTGTYFENSPVTLTAKPATGMRLEKWLVDGVEYSTETTIELTLMADTSVVVEFVDALQPEIPTRWEGTNVTERVTLPPGDYEFANVNFLGGIDLEEGNYKFKNDGGSSVNSIADLNGPLANVTFTGKGRMNIVGEGDTTLFAVQDLIVSNGVFAVNFTSTVEETAAVKVAGNFLLDDRGTVSITLAGAKPRGIELPNKKMKATFAGGTFTATLGGTKASAFKFKGSDAVTFSGGTMDVEITGTGAKVINGGTIVFEDGYICNVTGDEEASDATVFEAGKTLTINGGTFDISVPSEGSQILTTADDPEEKDLTLTINGGTFNLLAGDDCVKSAGNDAATDPKSVNTERNVVINGGNFYGVSLGNDVIDSNGDIIITGGNVLAYTTAVEEDGNGLTGLDVNVGRVIDVQGGNVIAIGGPNSSFHYEEGVAFTADELDATEYSEKFIELNGKGRATLTRVWAKLPTLDVETISLFCYTPGIDPTIPPKVSDETPPEEFATGFHDLYIDEHYSPFPDYRYYYYTATKPNDEFPAAWADQLTDMPADVVLVLSGEGENGFAYSKSGNVTFNNLHLIFESGVHSFTRINDGQTTQFANGAMPEIPTMLVMDGATLTITSKDFSGWNCTVDTTGIIRVNDGGTLNLVNDGGSTFFFSQQLYLDAGAQVNVTQSSKDRFRVNGGINRATPQIYMPPSDGGVATITMTDGYPLNIGKDNHPNAAIFVGDGSTLIIDGDIQGLPATEAGRELVKYGTGKLKITGKITNVTYTEAERPTLCKVDGHSAGTFEEALRFLSVEGSILEIVDEERMSYEGSELIIDGQVVDLKEKKLTLREEDGVLILRPEVMPVAGSVLYISEIMPKPTDARERGTLEGMDPNGLESGWVELDNPSDCWVDLANYRFIRVNRSKKLDTDGYGNFPHQLVAPHSKIVFYTSERYANSADMAVSAFATPVDAEEPTILSDELHGLIVWPDKVNPKKSPFVRLYYTPDESTLEVVDTVVVPSDLPEGASIIVGRNKEGEATARWICEAPTKGMDNPSTDGLVKIGPNVGPLYEIASGKKTGIVSEFDLPVPPAKPGEDYVITFAANPVMNPSGGMTVRSEDSFTRIQLVYRTDLDDKTLKTIEVDISSPNFDKSAWGNQYTATIPNGSFPEAGHLIQWKFLLTDNAGNEWTSPSFHNPDDGYEWYGTIVEPTEEQISENLTTWHMFAEEGVADKPGDGSANYLMNKDSSASGYITPDHPNGARVAIYDSSTQQYYDYVRVDLRGNTTASFKKKSHGLRFAKAHPLTTKDCLTGEDVEEIRKSSLIAEYADPTFMRQMMAFWVFNKNGSKAPFDFPVRVNMNGKFYQLAFHSERFTDELIEDVYGLDKYCYSYKSIGTWGAAGTAGGIEKKTPDDENESDISVLTKFTSTLPTKLVDSDADQAKYTKIVAEKMDIPSWFNYMALSRITYETDDIWANLCGYLDDPTMMEGVRGTGAWYPLAYDMNLSFGQYYHQVDCGGLSADEDWFKSHPFYGGFKVRAYKNAEMLSTEGNANHVYEAIYQNEKFRRLYLRRLRTLMDKELGKPNEEETLATSTIPFVKKMREFAALINADAEMDRKIWGFATNSQIDVWRGGTEPKSVQAGLEDLWENYVVPRREHLYVTHSIDAENVGYGNEYAAGIPHEQSAIVDLREGITAEYDATIGAVVIRNANEETIDLSDWELSGPVSMTLPAGTVIDQMVDGVLGEVYVTADRRATIAAMSISDQIVVGNGEAGKGDAKLTLTAADGTKVIFEPSEVYNYLRLHSFDGIPPTAVGDTDEWIALTNLSNEVELNLAGVKVNFIKQGDAESKCEFTLGDSVVISAGGAIILKQSEIGWDKITNNKLYITITDADGAKVQDLAVTQKDFKNYYGEGGPGGAYYLQATTFAQDSESFIEVAYQESGTIVEPGKPAIVEAESEEEAIKKSVLVVETPEIEGLNEETYKGYFKLIAEKIEGEENTFIVMATLNPEVVPAPQIDALDVNGESMTMQTTESAAIISVNIINAKLGLWYGYEATGDLGVDFVNDVGSFKQATNIDETLTLESTPREGDKGFFRVKVLEKRPEE